MRLRTPLMRISVMPEPGGPGGPAAPTIFGRSVNPIRTGEGRLSPPITTGPLNVFHLPASLDITCYNCTAKDSWCFYINDLIKHGSEA